MEEEKVLIILSAIRADIARLEKKIDAIEDYGIFKKDLAKVYDEVINNNSYYSLLNNSCKIL